MNITITGGNLPLARAFAEQLRGTQRVRLVDGEPVAAPPAGVEALTGDLRDPEFAAAATTGCQVVAHLAPLQTEGPDLERIDRATRGTFVLLSAAMAAGVDRVVLGSTLDLYRGLPAPWRVSESWRPRPEPILDHLGPWLAELSAREFAHAYPARQFVCLRFGSLVGGAAEQPGRIDRLHRDDAVAALGRALTVTPQRDNWSVYHLASGGPRLALAVRPPFEFSPRYDLGGAGSDERSPAGSQPPDGRAVAIRRPIHRVVVYGAGGPLAAAAGRLLGASYRLRLTDLVPLEAIVREQRRQSPNAPLPELLGPPHELAEVDVADPEQTAAAAAGMDAILNCTVIRHDPVEAFRVNTLGAYNIARAAVAHGIRRVVQTGPQLVTLAAGTGYWADYDVPGDAPPRAGEHLYGHSKYLGQEILRVFADHYGLEVPVLLFCIFIDPERETPGRELNPFTVSWEDAAHAIRRALEVASLPSSYEVMNVNADLPHGRITNSRAKQLLGWEPRHRLERFWTRPEDASR
jgi:nucleoside-diphosphate-sugar epimerase